MEAIEPRVGGIVSHKIKIANDDVVSPLKHAFYFLPPWAKKTPSLGRRIDTIRYLARLRHLSC